MRMRIVGQITLDVDVSEVADAQHAIVSVTSDGDADPVALATTEAAHGLSDGQTIDISGNSVPGYNGTHLEVTVRSATTFTFSRGYLGDGTGGEWQPG